MAALIRKRHSIDVPHVRLNRTASRLPCPWPFLLALRCTSYTPRSQPFQSALLFTLFADSKIPSTSFAPQSCRFQFSARQSIQLTCDLPNRQVIFFGQILFVLLHFLLRGQVITAEILHNKRGRRIILSCGQ